MIDEFKDSKKKVDEFKKSLINPQGNKNVDSFFYAILYAIRYSLTEKSEPIENDDELKSDVKLDRISEIVLLKEKIRLDFDMFNFENKCHQINHILNINNLFLRVFEPKDKFHSLIKQDPDKKNVIRELPSCITEKYNGFHIARMEFAKKLIQKFVSIDIVYKPVRKCTKIVNCYFSNKLNLAFRLTFSENSKIRHGAAFQCYFCSSYYGRKDKFDRHLDCCTGRPGYVYNFNTQSLVTFEENLKYKGDIPLPAYIDFETTALTDECLDPESKKKNVCGFLRNNFSISS